MTTLQIETATLTARDYLIAWGTANGWDIPDALKRRDPKEPGRRVKEKAEDELYRIFRQYWSRQRKFTREWLEFKYPGRKAVNVDPLGELSGMYGDATINAKVLNWLLKALQSGFIIFDDLNLIGIDYTLANVAAAKYARKYATKLIDLIDDGTRANIKEAIGTFIETPGFTVGDVMKSMDPSWGEARALRIAVTETTSAFAESEQIAGEELQREFPEERIVKQWWTNNDDLVCRICEQNHETITLLDGIFPSGHDKPYAHPNCLPGNTLVLPVGNISAGSKRWYKGDVVTIETLENELTVTPNHPILTDTGWVAAGDIVEGDNVICYKSSEWIAASVQINDQNSITTIKDKFGSLDLVGFRMPVTPPDFHNDGAGSNIAIIRTNSQIMNNVKPDVTHPLPEQDFSRSHIVSQTSLSSDSPFAEFIKTDFSTTGGFMGSNNLVPPLDSTHSLPLESLGFGLAMGLDTGSNYPTAESPAINASLFRESVLTLTGKVTLQKVVKIGNDNFTGHVYNLQTDSGLYVAAGIITHNCRCWMTTYADIVGDAVLWDK